MLWPVLPEAVRVWSVERVRCVHEKGTFALDALPGSAGLDHEATYLLDLAAP